MRSASERCSAMSRAACASCASCRSPIRLTAGTAGGGRGRAEGKVRCRWWGLETAGQHWRCSQRHASRPLAPSVHFWTGAEALGQPQPRQAAQLQRPQQHPLQLLPSAPAAGSAYAAIPSSASWLSRKWRGQCCMRASHDSRISKTSCSTGGVESWRFWHQSVAGWMAAAHWDTQQQLRL